MASIRAEMAADLAVAIALYGETFEWNGTEYDCVRRDKPTAQDLAIGGFVDGVEAAIVVAKSAFPGYTDGDFPQIGDLVNDSAHIIHMMNGHKDPAALQLVLYIGSVDSTHE